MNTAIYARISEDRQDGAGVARQLEDARALVDKRGWGAAQEFVDNDFSASRYATRSRPAYGDLLTAIRAGDVGRVVVYHTDRLYRQPRELEDIIDLAEHGQAQVVSVHSGDLNLSNSDGIAMARVMVAFAAKESDDKSRRVKRAKQQAREKGLPNGGRRAFGWKDGMTPEPAEVTLIRKAMSDLLAGASLADIAREWVAAGVGQPQTGKARWSADSVRQVVSNPRHAGLMGHRVHMEGDRYARPVVVGNASWPSIVDRETWEGLMALLADRGASNRVPRRRSLLTGLLACELCGATMVRTGPRVAPGKPANRSAWRCSTQKGCGRVSISGPPLEALLTEATIERLDTSVLAAMVRKQGDDGRRSEALIQQLGALDLRLREAGGSFARGAIPASAFEAATSAIEHERERLQGKLARVASLGVVAPYVGNPGLLRKRWPDLTEDQRRALIGITLGKVAIAPGSKPGMPTFDPSRVRVVGPVGEG